MLNLVNVYGSVPHNMTQEALGFCVRQKLRCINLFMFRLSTAKYIIEYIGLENGIAMGCFISLVLFVVVMEVIRKGLKPEHRFNQGEVELGALMDDLTIVQDNTNVARDVLSRLSEMISWSQMAFKLRKSRSFRKCGF